MPLLRTSSLSEPVNDARKDLVPAYVLSIGEATLIPEKEPMFTIKPRFLDNNEFMSYRENDGSQRLPLNHSGQDHPSQTNDRVDINSDNVLHILLRRNMEILGVLVRLACIVH